MEKTLRDRILNEALNTIGYHESENKAEFRKGVEIALNKAAPFFDQVVDTKDSYVREADAVRADFTTIIDILDRYRERG